MIQYFFHLFDRFFVSNEIYYTTCKNSLKSRFFQVFFIKCQILSFSKIQYFLTSLYIYKASQLSKSFTIYKI